MTFAKSSIHNMGIVALCDLPRGSMVLEYRGERIRQAVADRREVLYRSQRKDIFLFGVSDPTNDDEPVVYDTTECGTIGRFMNHSCLPSTFMKILTLGGRMHLVWCARRDIAAGEELTYDYRFAEDDEESSRMQCLCGAPNCRGLL